MTEPLFKVDTKKCTLCFACIRNCPVKAIDIKELTDWADISPERCVGCGICYHVCPVNAISYRQNIYETEHLLKENNSVIAICDPTIASEFIDISDYKKFVSMLRALGFKYVHEAAFAVDIAANKYKQLFSDFKGKYYLTGNCPSVVELIEKYHPELIENLSPIPSPMIIATAIMHEIYGSEAKIVYIGPCIANKNELLKYNDNFRPDIAITYEELRIIFDNNQITESKVEFSDFDKPIGEKGALYGISEGILESCSPDKSLLTRPIQTADGAIDVMEAVSTFQNNHEMLHKHLNLFFCEGCAMGPGTSRTDNKHARCSYIIDYAQKRISTLNYTNWESEINKYNKIDTTAKYLANNQRKELPSEAEIEKVLNTLNTDVSLDHGCGACGFKNCKELAIGIVQGYGHVDMCLKRSVNGQKALSRFMKQNDERVRLLKDEIEKYKSSSDENSELFANASKTVTAVINELSAGVILVDNRMKIVQTNQKFIEIVGEEAEMINDVIPGLKGADLKSLLPAAISSMFEFAVQNNESVVDKDITINDTKFILNVFTITTDKLAGAIIRNFHAPEVQYDEFIKRMTEVVDENLIMVQQMGFLLGEGASKTERMLNSIIESFKEEVDPNKK